MFVKLTARQTCESVISTEGNSPRYCLGEMQPGDTVLITHGPDTIEVWCRPCAAKRFDRIVDPH